MAKMFYSMEEVQDKLHRSAEDIKQLVKDGKLREFRDGAKIMFKVDEVDKLDVTDLGGTGEIKLAPGDSSDKISLAGDTGNQIGLAGGTGSSVGLVPGDSADQISLDDTGEAKTNDDTVITSHGVNVLDDSDGELAVDPMAQTQIAPDLDDQVHLDSGSSGSGLLDLTREADDTSLGAELLEEIYPGAEENAVETQIPTQLDLVGSGSASSTGPDSMMAMETQAPAMATYVRTVEVQDPTSGVFGVMLLVPLLALVYAGWVAAANIRNVQAPLLDTLSEYVWYVCGGAAVLAALILLVGNSMAKKASLPAAASKAPKAAKPAKAAKPVKTKAAK
jgi:hypothetical protein